MPMTLDGTSGMTAPQGAVYNGLQTATAQSSGSGTTIDFTGIPLWVKRITVMFSGVSLSGGDYIQLRIGSGTIQTTGYSSGVWSNSTNTATSTTAFYVTANGNSANVWHGTAVLINVSGNIWVCSVTMGQQGGPNSNAATGGGSVTLTGSLDRLRVLNDGTNAFDAGTINVMYE